MLHKMDASSSDTALQSLDLGGNPGQGLLFFGYRFTAAAPLSSPAYLLCPLENPSP